VPILRLLFGFSMNIPNGIGIIRGYCNEGCCVNGFNAIIFAYDLNTIKGKYNLSFSKFLIVFFSL